MNIIYALVCKANGTLENNHTFITTNKQAVIDQFEARLKQDVEDMEEYVSELDQVPTGEEHKYYDEVTHGQYNDIVDFITHAKKNKRYDCFDGEDDQEVYISVVNLDKTPFVELEAHEQSTIPEDKRVR